MATKKAGFEAQLFAWGSAAGVAALVFVLLLALGGWGIVQAIWMAAVTFLLLGAFNYFVFAAPTPPLAGRLEPTGVSYTPPATAAAKTAAPAAAAAAAAAPASAAPAPQPGPAPEPGGAAEPKA